jgi:hypothetical protein
MVLLYTQPLRCITDKGNEFLGTEFQELLRSYSVQSIHITIKNSQANFVEHVHQTQGNMNCTHKLENFEFDHNDPIHHSQHLGFNSMAKHATPQSSLNSLQALELSTNIFSILQLLKSAVIGTPFSAASS